eukprot:gb/GECG01006634.1/.p2 GENE.gb/GECG01006634.1/~~gb/GECG01006634.1/.p2  ORF type:complete len:101 (-),score=2.26 gb/GECG01006634.1/:41-343(-)
MDPSDLAHRHIFLWGKEIAQCPDNRIQTGRYFVRLDLGEYREHNVLRKHRDALESHTGNISPWGHSLPRRVSQFLQDRNILEDTCQCNRHGLHQGVHNVL